MKRIGTFGIILGVLILITSNAWALSIIDNFSKPGFNITYDLNIYDTVGGTQTDPYHALFTITNNSNSANFVNGPWSIDWFAFKLFDGSPVIFSDPALSFNPQDGYYGVDLSPDKLLANTGQIYSLNFAFYDSGATLKDDYVNFMVDYTGGLKSNGGNYTGRLSSYLVPEPGMLLLLGSGILGLGVYGKRFRK